MLNTVEAPYSCLLQRCKYLPCLGPAGCLSCLLYGNVACYATAIADAFGHAVK